MYLTVPGDISRAAGGRGGKARRELESRLRQDGLSRPGQYGHGQLQIGVRAGRPAHSAGKVSLTMTGKVHLYEDFAAWRTAAAGQPQTVGDAMRRFTGTSLETILSWWSQHQDEQRQAWAPGASGNMTGPVQEVTFTGGSGVKPAGAGYLLRWAASPRGGANLETPSGRLAGFLVADGKDGGRQLFAAYRPPAEPGTASEGVIRHATADQGLAAILGPPAAPYTSYGTCVPAVRLVKQYTMTSSGNTFRQYEGPGGRRVDVKMRQGRTGQVRYTQREATAEARRLLGLVPQAAGAAEPEMG